MDKINNNNSQFSIKYRPYNIDDVVGQTEIVKAVKARMKDGRWPTAMLLQGPSGTGKTTVAKIIAMAINCENPTEEEPVCGHCVSCKSIAADAYDRDVIIIDASQQGQKDSVLELTSLLKTRPLMDKHRIVLIDEIDQASSAFKLALLKILEKDYTRNPTHFILMSMEPNGVPYAIKSRCQCFNFKPISNLDIMKALFKTLQKLDDSTYKEPPESFIKEGLPVIAASAKGSLRAGLQNLEACLEAECYTPEQINDLLGTVDEVSTFKILQGLLNKSNDEIMWANIYKADPQELYNYMTLLLSNAMIYKTTGYIDNESFRSSTTNIANSPNVDSLFDILTMSPQLNKPYMRKCDLLSALASYYRVRKIGNEEQGEKLLKAIGNEQESKSHPGVKVRQRKVDISF